MPGSSTRLFASVALTDSGNLVAATTGKITRIHSLVLVFSGACTFTFNNGSGGTAKSGTIKVQDSGGFVLPESDAGWWATTSGVAPYITLSTPTTVGGIMTYETE